MKPTQFAFFSKDAELIRGLLNQVKAAIKDAEDLSLSHDLYQLEESLEGLLKKYGG